MELTNLVGVSVGSSVVGEGCERRAKVEVKNGMNLMPTLAGERELTVGDDDGHKVGLAVGLKK